MLFRKALPEDSFAVSDLIYKSAIPLSEKDFDVSAWESFCSSIAANKLEDQIKNSKIDTYVLEENGKILGIISISKKQQINLFFISSVHQNKGLGSLLWSKALNEVKPHSLKVFSSSLAVNFYKSLGFLETQNGIQKRNGYKFHILEYTSPNMA